MTSTETISLENELVEIFRTSPGTTGEGKVVTNRLKRWWQGLEKDEDLVVGTLRNGDLTMIYVKAVNEVTSQILKLRITDSKAGVSTDSTVTEKDDLVHRLRVMEKQRARKGQERWDEAMT